MFSDVFGRVLSMYKKKELVAEKRVRAISIGAAPRPVTTLRRRPPVPQKEGGGALFDSALVNVTMGGSNENLNGLCDFGIDCCFSHQQGFRASNTFFSDRPSRTLQRERQRANFF